MTYTPVAPVSVEAPTATPIPTPDSIPLSLSDGTLDPGWIPDEFVTEDELNTALAAGRSLVTFGTAEASLGGMPRRSGEFTLILTHRLEASQVGRPVIVVQAPGPYPGKGEQPDSAECDMVTCVAEVLAVDKIRVYWRSFGMTRGTLRFHYIVGFP